MEIGYIGGIVKRGAADWPARTDWERWHWAGAEFEACLLAGGAGCRLYSRGELCVLLRGFIADTWAPWPGDMKRLADRIIEAYRDEGTLCIDGLEGNFTIALLDGPAGKLLLYRNLIGDSHTYYREEPRGVLIGSNLAQVIECCEETPRPNQDDLPAFFLNRMVPGRNTLFAGFHRLLPGEQLQVRDGRVR